MSMYTVYILISEKDFKLYVGCTQDMEKRLHAHNAGYVDATKARRPLTPFHQEQYQSKAEAFQRERFLKSLWSARFKQKLRRTYLARSVL